MRVCIAVIAACFATAQAQIPVMTPPEELKKLDWLVGDWTFTLSWQMEGMEMEVPGTMKVEREGQFVKMILAHEMGDMKFTETMYISWDAAKQRYTSYTFTNISPQPRIEHGNMQGDTWTMVSEPWDAGIGETMTSRASIIRQPGGSANFVLEFREGDGWTKAGTGVFKKKVW